MILSQGALLMRGDSCEMMAVEEEAWWQGGRLDEEAVAVAVAGWSKRGGWGGRRQLEGGRGRY